MNLIFYQGRGKMAIKKLWKKIGWFEECQVVARVGSKILTILNNIAFERLP